MAKTNRHIQHRPAGLSSDSDSDDFDFGSDVKASTNQFLETEDSYQIKSINKSYCHDNHASDDNSRYKSSTNQVIELQDQSIAQEIGSLQNRALSNNEQNGTSFWEEPSIVVTRNDEVNGYNNNHEIPLLLDVSNCVFKDNDFQNTERETSSNYGSYSTQSSFRLSPVNCKKFQKREGSSLPLEEFRMASVQGNLPVVKELINQGLSVDQILKSGWTALMFASSCGKDDLVLYLLQQGADPNLHKEMFTALMAACASSQESEADLLACVNHLLNFGANPDACERHRMTPLMFACKEGRVTIVDALVNSKVDVNKQDNKGWTALCWAATKGHGRVVRKLLVNAADPSKMNMHGQRPADIAHAAGFVELADVLERSEKQGYNANGFEDTKVLERSQISPNSTRNLKSHTTSAVINCSEMEMVLSGLDLTDLIPLFQNHKITLECFLRLHENDFERIGIEELGTRKKLAQAIADIHKQEWKTTSLPNLSQVSYITLPDAVSLISNINKQLRFIHASVGYLRDQIQATPRILELGQEKHNVATLADTFSASLKNILSLGEEVKFFKAHLDKVCDNVEYSSADLIVIRKDDGRRWQRRLLASLLAATSFATMLYFCRPRTFASIFSLTPYPQASVLLDVNP